MPLNNPLNPIEKDFRLQIIRKTADQTVNNSIVLINDTHLKLPVGANEVWLIEYCILLNALIASDFQYLFVIPAGGNLYALYDSTTQATENILNNTVLVAAIALIIDTSVLRYLSYKALYVGGANAGDIQLKWAQNVAVVENTTVLTNSFIMARKL